MQHIGFINQIGPMNKTKPALGNVIFIDDVVTTGATASSAKNALETAVNFQVWALAHRRDLAGADPL
jgi:predicted amidophosphoribosyltransferase